MSTGAAGTQRLLTEERRRKILELLDQQGRVTVAELGERFGISTVTARADLDALAALGALVRSHGGAVKPIPPVQDYPLNIKEKLYRAEKVRIAQAAAEFVRPEQTIVFDSGSTTMEVVRELRARHVRPLAVITNGLNIAFEMGNAAGVSVIMLGGMLRNSSLSVVGPQAEQSLRDLNADHLFLGVDGFDVDTGPSTPDILEAQLNALMIRVSRETTVVVDSSKFRRRSLSLIARTDSIHRVITDTGLDPTAASALRGRGVELILV